LAAVLYAKIVERRLRRVEATAGRVWEVRSNDLSVK
jgi:hypothetical protein